MEERYFFQLSHALEMHGFLLTSINTIWNIYVFVLLGMVGWILSRAHEFLAVQKILTTIVFSIFNAVVIFYFKDAYHELGMVKTELHAIALASGRPTVPGGISERLLTFDPNARFHFVSSFIGGNWAFLVYLIWAKRIWPKSAADTPPASPNERPTP